MRLRSKPYALRSKRLVLTCLTRQLTGVHVHSILTDWEEDAASEARPAGASLSLHGHRRRQRININAVEQRRWRLRRRGLQFDKEGMARRTELTEAAMGTLLGIEYVLPCKPIVHVVHVAPLADIRAARLCEARSLHDGECSHTAEDRGRLGVEELHGIYGHLPLAHGDSLYDGYARGGGRSVWVQPAARGLHERAPTLRTDCVWM